MSSTTQQLQQQQSHPTSIKELEALGVRYIRFYWVDFINFVRYRVIPIAHFKKLLEPASGADGSDVSESADTNVNPRKGIMLTHAAFGLVYLSLAEGFGSSGEHLYVPDITTARIIPYLPDHASVLGWFEEKESFIVNPKDDKTQNQSESQIKTFKSPFCPRNHLRTLTEKALQEYDITFLLGFETEVIFLKSVDPIEAVNDYGWSESPAIVAGSNETNALMEIADALVGAGIDLEMYHSEAAPGQFEIVTGPLPPLEACDALISTRETIMNVAAKYGIRATLAPRVYSNSCGSAAHTHVSLKSKNSTKRYPAPGTPNVHLTKYEQSFLAGLLEHLPAIIAFTLPTPASYDRMVDGVWSGGTWASWGRDNRECPIRLCGASSSNYNFEVKCVDGTANCYLAATAIIAAGLSGIEKKAKLEMHGLTGLASLLSDEERREAKVSRRLPLNIEEGRKALVEDSVMEETFGAEVIQTYLSVNRKLEKMLEGSNAEETMKRMVKTY